MEDARQKAEAEQEKIKTEIFSQAEANISSAILSVYKHSEDIKKSLIKEIQEIEKVTDVTVEKAKQPVIKKSSTKPKKEIHKKEIEVATEKATDEKDSTKKKSKSNKLRRVSISEIESRLESSGNKKRKEKKKKKKKKREIVIDAKQVDESIRKTMAKMDEKSTKKKYKKKDKSGSDESETRQVIRISEFATVETLAKLMDIDPADIIQICIELGMFVTINQRLDFDTILLITEEFNFEVEQLEQYGEEFLKIEETEEDLENAEPRPPVIAIMGHVDHGKTTLLDNIRNANVVGGEAGGITQHIGAYQVQLPSKQYITFLDTPGHEAFTEMRSRGAQVTDMVILIVAADDGVMPRTIEAINHAKAAGVPMVIAVNKIDKPDADPERVYRELSENNILVEKWGGEVQVAEISALTGKGIDKLLDLIILEAEMMELKANQNTLAQGTVIEARVDKRHGSMATILIQKGCLEIGNPFVCGAAFGRVRAMFDEYGKNIKIAKPGKPVIVTGLDILPHLADIFSVVKDPSEARKIALERQKIEREHRNRQDKEWTLDTISKHIADGEVNQLNIVLKCDVDGSVEAIKSSLAPLGNNEVSTSIIHSAAGIISENDILLAKTSQAIVIGFNVTANPKIKELAKKENVEIRNYSVIYELIDDINTALEGMLSPEKIEIDTGKATVKVIIKIPKLGIIAGSYINEGVVNRLSKVRLIRDNKTIFTGDISSLKRFKDDVKEVKEGYECGIGLENFNNIKENDVMVFYKIKSVKRKLEKK